MTDLEINYFLKIVNQGCSFTRAAEALYVSQPALTHHIKVLGTELGVKLFDTSIKNDVKLTPAGKLYYDFFLECREKFEKISNTAKNIEDQKTGRLSFACVGGWDVKMFLNKQKTFCEAFPRMNFSIAAVGLKRLKNGLMRNQYDLVLAMSDQFRGEPNVSMYTYARVPLILLFSAIHPLAKEDGLGIINFKEDIFFCPADEENNFIKRNCESYCKSKGFVPRLQFMPNMESILLALETGRGCTIFDDLVQVKRDPRFNYIRLDGSVTISYVWKSDNDNKALKLFLENAIYSC